MSWAAQSGEGGTSLSSPLMVGMWARIQAAARGGTGFANPLDLRRRQERHPGRARISTTTRSVPTAPTRPLPGWDYVSGWGTPNLTPLMKDIDHGKTAPIQTG